MFIQVCVTIRDLDFAVMGFATIGPGPCPQERHHAGVVAQGVVPGHAQNAAIGRLRDARGEQRCSEHAGERRNARTHERHLPARRQTERAAALRTFGRLEHPAETVLDVEVATLAYEASGHRAEVTEHLRESIAQPGRIETLWIAQRDRRNPKAIERIDDRATRSTGRALKRPDALAPRDHWKLPWTLRLCAAPLTNIV